MKFSSKKIIFTTLPIALGVFLIWYSLSKLKPEDIEAIKNSFRTANYWWVACSLFLGILSHLSRAYRWQFMLDPLGYRPKFANNVMAVLVAYLVNLIVPRAGEIARATTISKYENIPFEKAFGTIVSERVADAVMLLGIIGLAFIFQTELLSSYLFSEDDGSSGYTYYFLAAMGMLGVVFIWLIRKSKHPFAIKIQNFVIGLIQGIGSIFKMKKKWAFIFHTFFIWVMYVLMFYVVTFALPETTHLAFGAIIVGFVVGGLSMALTNGGLGSYPIFVASALTLYGIDENPALAFGWIMWTAQTVMVLFFGGLSFLVLPIYNKEED
ncbi:lysylphosphatidylglycerol synthase transmembrane domain-containing protein [Lutimonas zeaxanthinifaciens]|uniref:lysylphosphatidylglycerol synthase transmembrane domain-containing protein n=1 Tax=Lutimonas zeaxanthinifaciens TaxID=3060215 RepID=UPI00265CC7E6|nr:lysylphosphatidylglycerol synthase transmembrane domain-containing protein [Lutimonas sp. YSD2104]WKK66238.1 lysylphosphatidylglycerol synthase transmembrane domain-containing protein [Lutimonas sp. YSD2104]